MSDLIVITPAMLDAAINNAPAAYSNFNPCPGGGTWQGVNAAGMNVCSGSAAAPPTADELALIALTQGPPPGSASGNTLEAPPVLTGQPAPIDPFSGMPVMAPSYLSGVNTAYLVYGALALSAIFILYLAGRK